jgi:undecaprenyl phosphate-alpha-L-ara4FN deformylase
MRAGLRIDVDTFRGTKYGVPNLCTLLDEYAINASFFFSVGPDNMGRHLWRLLRPAFLVKMLRTSAPGLYGWDIFLKGTFGPGPRIGRKLGHIIRHAARAGHEIGLHAWDHHRWQSRIDEMTCDEIAGELKKGVETLTELLGSPPTCSAVPGWKCNDKVLVAKEAFGFRYNSDCRGETIFRPVVAGTMLEQPQIPVTLPTYDEVIGRNGISNSNYNEYILSLLDCEKLNVLTIHAEVEGIACHEMFKEFIVAAHNMEVQFVPLSTLLDGGPAVETASVAPEEIAGREGWVACCSNRSATCLSHSERH